MQSTRTRAHLRPCLPPSTAKQVRARESSARRTPSRPHWRWRRRQKLDIAVHRPEGRHGGRHQNRGPPVAHPC
ncbi:hypothetical protein B0H10DRAFT_2043875 [Mycena sp. CBHHK59/15]|nr:hypothetical protein B0H10DRAFT_2043875 [Mycena sp. CBHHK59/15]